MTTESSGVCVCCNAPCPTGLDCAYSGITIAICPCQQSCNPLATGCTLEADEYWQFTDLILGTVNMTFSGIPFVGEGLGGSPQRRFCIYQLFTHPSGEDQDICSYAEYDNY